MTHAVFILRCLSVLALAGGLGLASAHADSDTFMADCRALTRNPHRLAGTDEGRAAADHLAQRLREIGVDEVVVQPFPVAQTVPEQCEMRVTLVGGETRTLPLFPCRADGIVPPVTPPDGISGPVIHVPTGEPGDFGKQSPEGAIVVLDFNSRDGWLRAFRMGARAVVFVSAGDQETSQSPYVEADVNLPRFYYAGDPNDLAQVVSARIDSHITWKASQGHNVFGYIRGMHPLFHLGQEELAVLATPFDSFGAVPRLSGGARGAANAAALLQMAQELTTHRPARNVLISFFDNQARGHAGVSAFYRGIENANVNAAMPARENAEQNETAFLNEMLAVLNAVPSASSESDIRRQLERRFKDKAGESAFAVNDVLMKLRAERRDTKDGSPEQARVKAALAENEIIREQWNTLRRYLAKPDGQPLPAPIAGMLQGIREDVARDVEIRLNELAILRDATKSAKALHAITDTQWIVLHVSLLFGDRLPCWGIAVGGDSDWRSEKDRVGLYGRLQRTFLESAVAVGAGAAGFLHESVDDRLAAARLWSPPYLVHSGEVAGLAGIYNVVFCTVQDPFSREGTPADTLDNLNANIVQQQAAESVLLLRDALSRDGLSQRRAIESNPQYVLPECSADGRISGPSALARSPGSSVPNKRMPGAVVRLTASSRGMVAPKIAAFDNFQVQLTDRNGSYFWGPLAPEQQRDLNAFAAAFDNDGRVSYASSQATSYQTAQRLNMFESRAGVVVLPPQMSSFAVSVMSARANSALDPSRSYTKTLDSVAYWYCEKRIDAIKLFGLNSVVALVNGPERLGGAATDTPPDGLGLPMQEDWTLPVSARRSAVDLWRLDESRIQILRSRGVMNSSVEALHGSTEDLLLDAQGTEDMDTREAMQGSAFLRQRGVYSRVRTALDDLVRAVLILLALCVPFAFVAERLLIGAATIYRRLLGFCAFFLATFMVLYFTHPAFAVSATPIIIFLGFAIVLLSSLVITVIMGKFESELKVLQGMGSTVHAADVSRLSTTIAAMSMGISTMRRRPLRTTLTAVTVILLTFTILCFASFGTRAGIIRHFVAPPTAYTGLLLHHANWGTVSSSLPELIRGRWGDAQVCRRYWLSPRQNSAGGVVLSRKDGSQPLAMRGVLGMEDTERHRRPDLTAALPSEGETAGHFVWLSPSVCKRLDIEPGETVLIAGERLTLAPSFDPHKLATIRDMDNSSVLPVDFSVSNEQQGDASTEAADLAETEGQNWALLPVDSVAVVDADTARRMGASLRAVSAYTKDETVAVDMAEELARMTGMAVSATASDGVYRHLFGDVLQASGVKELLFPLLLGGLVIFGTMLGSVADREREIYTFSALGLAPPHVASLFFSEAVVFSILGGVSGYLLAQASVKVMEWLAALGLMQVPEINYSSMNAIITILVVMLTVIVSALYPALKASRSANPGLLRNWKVPEPEGDVLSLVFPFTVSAYDITGVVSFLKEHFDNFSESGMGLFIAKGARLARPDGEEKAVGLSTHLALAPYDLGVTQTFQLSSQASEIKGIDEVKIVIERMSGQPKDWRRLNKVLLSDVRKQFLIWRSLPETTMEIYRKRTLSQFGAPNVNRIVGAVQNQERI